jgi:uncharacterized protein (UPF0548 family)
MLDCPVLTVISARLPKTRAIESLLGELETTDFSYPHVGATREAMPAGYNIDRRSAVVGRGAEDFERAKQGIRNWAHFDLPWVRVFPQSQPAPGVLVAVVARVFGFWWTNVNRVIYLIDEPERFGFAYGTLALHAESGEECFEVERSRETDEVRYRILAFSKPRHRLARLGYPMSRAAQSRFAMGSIEAIRRTTSQPRENAEKNDNVS